jgi:hypothetical protein
VAPSSPRKSIQRVRCDTERLAAFRELESENQRGTRVPFELSDDDLASFIAMWQEEFGEVLTIDQARFEATRLLEFFVTLSNAFIHSAVPTNPKHGRMAA